MVMLAMMVTINFGGQESWCGYFDDGRGRSCQPRIFCDGHEGTVVVEEEHPLLRLAEFDGQISVMEGRKTMPRNISKN